MGNIFINNILLPAIITIVGGAITYLIVIVINYLMTKKTALIAKIGVDQYNSDLIVAKNIFLQAEQMFKLIPGAGNLKSVMFDKLILAKIPELTQDEITHLKESATGAFNANVKPLLAPAFNPLTDEVNPLITDTKPIAPVEATTSSEPTPTIAL